MISKSSEYSKEMFSQTEREKMLFTKDVIDIIKFRYLWAAELCKGKDTLEIGCGAGLGVSYLASLSKSYIGIEYSRENYKHLIKHYPSNTFLNIDAHNMAFKKESFGFICALAMIYYLDINIILKKVKFALDEHGIFFFCTSNKDVPGFCKAPYTTDYYSIPDLNEIITSFGFCAEFYGAFPKSNKPIFFDIIIAYCKNLAKFTLKSIGLKKLWCRFKKSISGELFHLSEISHQDSSLSEQRVRLDKKKKNYKYRVIYVKCRKKD